MYFMKGIIQTVTLVPIPSGTDMCINRTFVAMITEFGNCADMMFSGHTALAYITTPKNIRWLVVPIVGVLLLLAKMHYMSDIVVAVIVAQWIEFQIPMPLRTTTTTAAVALEGEEEEEEEIVLKIGMENVVGKRRKNKQYYTDFQTDENSYSDGTDSYSDGGNGSQ